jgi:hypothetical protein
MIIANDILNKKMCIVHNWIQNELKSQKISSPFYIELLFRPVYYWQFCTILHAWHRYLIDRENKGQTTPFFEIWARSVFSCVQCTSFCAIISSALNVLMYSTCLFFGISTAGHIIWGISTAGHMIFSGISTAGQWRSLCLPSFLKEVAGLHKYKIADLGGNIFFFS